MAGETAPHTEERALIGAIVFVYTIAYGTGTGGVLGVHQDHGRTRHYSPQASLALTPSGHLPRTLSHRDPFQGQVSGHAGPLEAVGGLASYSIFWRKSWNAQE